MLSTYQVNQIIASVEREIQLHLKYNELIAQERDAVMSIALDNCRSFVSKRATVCDQISQERNRRKGLLNSFVKEGAPERLSDYAKAHFVPLDQRRILPLIEKLRRLVLESANENQDFTQVLNFSLGMITSSLSIIRSANQEVQHRYNIQGLSKESFHPVTRDAALLREA